MERSKKKKILQLKARKKSNFFYFIVYNGNYCSKTNTFGMKTFSLLQGISGFKSDKYILNIFVK